MRRYSIGNESDRLIFSGPASALDRFGLTVRISYDEGDTWPIGRELAPPQPRQHTGYSSVARVADGVGVLFERRRPSTERGKNKQSIHYRWLNLAAVLCGRSEPMLIGGNAWMGNFTERIRHADGTLEYRGQGVFVGKKVEILVRASVKARSNGARQRHLRRRRRTSGRVRRTRGAGQAATARRRFAARRLGSGQAYVQRRVLSAALTSPRAGAPVCSAPRKNRCPCRRPR